MIRLLLIIFIIFICDNSWIANEQLDTSDNVSPACQPCTSSEYNMFNQHEFYDGIIGSSSNESNFFPDVKKNLISDFQIIDQIKSNGFYFTDVNLYYLTRKDNIFLSILRI